MSLRIAIVGATGLVGRTMFKVLEERQIELADIYPIATVKSRGIKLSCGDRDYTTTALVDNQWQKADWVLLSAGKSIARKWIPEFVKAGIKCIDNSSVFRMEPNVPLVVPEINADAISKDDVLIANPNCSTIQLVMVLEPLHQQFGLEETVVSTYQSAAGAGQTGVRRLNEEVRGEFGTSTPFPHPLTDNVIPAIGKLTESQYFMEEMKLVDETRKIMRSPQLKIFPTAVRVPIAYCHAEAVHLVFKNPITPADVKKVLSGFPGILIVDDPAAGSYPLPRKCHNRDEVFVGRIRQAAGETHTIDLWIVSDNLRKGAATNAIQILQLVLKR
jgi:aspartate-semialdehyde dehydrogenase